MVLTTLTADASRGAHGNHQIVRILYEPAHYRRNTTYLALFIDDSLEQTCAKKLLPAGRLMRASLLTVTKSSGTVPCPRSLYQPG